MTINPSDLKDRSILLVITGGIAAYKSLELIRMIRKCGGTVRCILTEGGSHFITPLSISALSGETTYTDLWSLKDETEMGHIRLSREADLIVIAPASADFLAKLAHGYANDLASTTLLAADKSVLFAPAMNHKMWANPATQDNIALLEHRGMKRIGPHEGDMACGEYGMGRMAEPEEIMGAISAYFTQNKPLAGKKALVTSGPTYEPLDPVRFIGNRSSGKQGHAIARALQKAGADVTLVTGPVALPDPVGVNTLHVETAAEMLNACQNALPVDVCVCAAAVSDWSPAVFSARKIKKRQDRTAPAIKMKENPDILATLSTPSPNRPALVIGFAAETNDMLTNASEKCRRKGCDWILANDVANEEKVFGADKNHVYLLSEHNTEEWPRAGKDEIARKLATEITKFFNERHTDLRKNTNLECA